MNDKRFVKYPDKGGDSGVRSTKRSQGQVAVRFKDGSTYTYTTQSAGQPAINNMRRQIKNGQGLNSYINRKVDQNYATKRGG